MASPRPPASSRALNISAASKAPNGVLSISASVTKKANMAPTQSKSPAKAGMPKLRLIVRRLPPGLTETEFQSALGDEWKVGAGKVDWAGYKDGKVSKDPSKPSKPARAYLRVKDQAYLDNLSTKIKQTTFQDAKNTMKDSCLLGPPSLEFAPFGKVPGSRVRHDGRQGTIDQDPEFIDFLHSLTEPASKPPANDDGAEAKLDKAAVTPLVQYIKEKKANKAKEVAAAKVAKAQSKQEAKDGKTEKSDGKKVSVIKKDAPTAAEKARREKATQDAVKAINKSVATMKGKLEHAKAATPSPAAKETTATSPPVKRERERGNASIANRILQRDLGLTPKERKSQAGKPATPAGESAKSSQHPFPKVNLPAAPTRNSQPPLATSQTTPARPQAAPTSVNPPTGPRHAQTPPAPASAQKPAPAPGQRTPKPPPQPSGGAKSAFLKHANPSQGITEPLLEATFSVFGTLTRCEIDKKKGFGYVDFADAEGLKKAIAASPVKVGQGQVVVLENRTRPAAPRNPGVPPSATSAGPPTQSTTPRAPAATSTTPSTPASPQLPSPTPAALSTPTAPRGAPIAVRSGRGGGYTGSPRGNFGPAGPRGRGGFRSGRGGFHGGQNRGGGTAAQTANTPAGSPASPAPSNAQPAAGT